MPSDVTFVTVLRHICWTFSVRYNMYLSIHVFYLCLCCYLFIYKAKYLRQYLSKTYCYVILNRKCHQ